MFTEEYKKESDGRVYLLLGKTGESFEERMIQKVHPPGVLSMVRSEQTDVYKYEITGKKSLAMTFERVPMNAEQIEKIVGDILDILEQGREYLLSEDNYVLRPEHIYLRIPEYEVTLCYYPEYNIPFTEQLGKLFEVLLNRVDYREEKAIETVYAMYMQLQEPDMTLERIREKLREPKREFLKQEKGGTGSPVQSGYNMVPERSTEKASPAKKAEGTLFSGNTEAKRPWIWERMREEFRGKRNRGADRDDRMVISPQAACVREGEPDWGDRYTRVLAVKKETAYPALISARNGETVFMTKFPFYVGSLPGYMDYVIPQDTISRFHAKFIRQGSRVLLVDLNSTNGTKVNGKGLNVGEQKLLTNGDRVTFADVDFSFFEKTEDAGL